MKTKISWELSNYCTAGCSYCPTKFWGGEKPRDYLDYIRAAEILINHYKGLGRSIDWTFTGGEPLEMFDFPAILKLCKEGGGTSELTTNGGKLWLDWWAIEPHIDTLHLTYHYWQNPNLIKFIIQAFRGKNKSFNVTVPIRPEAFEEDMERASAVEQEYEIHVHRQTLYQEADSAIGMMNYTETQLEHLYGVEWVDTYIRNKPKMTYAERHEERIQQNPSFTGKLCNVGIERVRISRDGWMFGSNCNTAPLGNIWGQYELPTGPQPCKMIACVNPDDQMIMKFD